MTRSITPERQELKAEAIRLRQAGWTQKEVSQALAVPRRTISLWGIPAKTVANSMGQQYNPANNSRLGNGRNTPHQ